MRLPLLIVLTVLPAHAQETPHGGGLPVNVLQWLGGLVTVLVAIFVLAYALRRLGGGSRLEPGRFQVLAALSVGARERVVLVQVGTKQLVLGVAPGQVQGLCVLTGDEVLTPTAPPSTRFVAHLNAWRAGKPS